MMKSKVKKIANTGAMIFGLVLAQMLPANPTLTPGTWMNISPQLGTGPFGQGITIDPNNPSTLYWSACDMSVSKSGIYKTTDAGSTWNKVGSIDQPIHIAIDPHNSNHIYCVDGVRGSTMGFWVSTDGGATWSVPAGFTSTVQNSTIGGTQDLYSVAVDPTDFNHALVSFHSPWANAPGACGVLESTDGGASWLIHMPDPGMSGPGYGVFFLYNPALGIGDKNTWLMGCQGNGFWRTSNAGTSWSHVSATAMTHGGDQTYYTRAGVLFIGAYGSPLRSTDNGITWQAASAGVGSGSWYIGIAGDGVHLYTGGFNATGNMITSQEADGASWTNFNAQQFPCGPFELAFDGANGIMYASNAGTAANSCVWALDVKDPATGMFLANAMATPYAVLDNATTSVTFSVDALASGMVTGVTINLAPIGGGASVPMTKSTGNTYTTTFTVQSGATFGGNKSLQLTAADDKGHTFYGSIQLTVLFHDTPVLVSQNKNVVVSSTQSAAYPGSAAVDGNLSTRWSSGAGDPQWIYVDLGSPMLVEQVVLEWETAYASSYEIQVSNDATTWTDVFSTTTGNGGTDVINPAPVSARYVRMYGTVRGSQYGYSLYEFQVYAPASGATATHKATAEGIVQKTKRPSLMLSQMSTIKNGEAVYNVKGEIVSAKRVSQQAVVVGAR